MEGKVSESKALSLINKFWNASEWKSKLEFVPVRQYVSDSFLADPAKTRTDSILKHLTHHSKVDALIIQCITSVLPMKRETSYILNYLIDRLSSKWYARQVEKYKTQIDQLSKVIQQIESTKIIQEWDLMVASKKLIHEFETEFLEIQEKFNASIKSQWIAKYLDARKERNNYKSMLNRLLKSIYQNKETKATYHIINEKIAEIWIPFNYICKRIFTYGNPRLKKWTNICKTKLNKLTTMMKNKIHGFLLQEELDAIQKFHLEEQGLLWAGLAKEIIEQNEQLNKIYNNLSLENKYTAMKMITNETQNLKNVKEIESKIKENIKINMKLLDSSTSSMSNLNLSALDQLDDQEWDEYEEYEEEINTDKVPEIESKIVKDG